MQASWGRGQKPPQRGLRRGHRDAMRGQEPGGAHPHLVVDQVQDGVVGDPVQGEAGQPLLQHLQQLLDGRAAGEQLRGKHHT